MNNSEGGPIEPVKIGEIPPRGYEEDIVDGRADVWLPGTPDVGRTFYNHNVGLKSKDMYETEGKLNLALL